MIFSLMAGDLYLSTKRHQQVQPRWVPNWTWNCDNDSSSSLHGTYGLVFSDQLVPNLLLTDLKIPNLNKSLLLWTFLCPDFEKYISFLTINPPTILFLWSLSEGEIHNYISWCNGHQWKLEDGRCIIYLFSSDVHVEVWIKVSNA